MPDLTHHPSLKNFSYKLSANRPWTKTKPMRSIVTGVLFLAGCLCVQSSLADSAQITEWKVPFENSRPRDPFVDSLGRVWFCGQAGAYLAYFEPGSAGFKKYDLDDGAAPHNLIIDSQNQIWFAANTLPYIGRLDPETGAVSKFTMPDRTARDPHTLVFDGEGNIWFTAQWSNLIGRLITATGQIDLVHLPDAGSRPYGIRVDSTGHAWAALFGTNKLARVNPETLALELVELPQQGSRPRRLEISDQGVIWYGDYSRGMLGRYDPAAKTFREWQLPGGPGSRPYAMTMDHHQNVWLAEAGSPNRLVEFNTGKQAFDRVVDVPNAQGSIRHMYFDGVTQSIWFGEDSNYIGRLRIP